jgi:hypothetical protein
MSRSFVMKNKTPDPRSLNWPTHRIFADMLFGVTGLYWNLVLHSRPGVRAASRWALIRQGNIYRY